MPRQPISALNPAAQRAALRRRLKSFYQQYDLGHWEQCCEFIDPRLREQGRIDPSAYAASLDAFRQRYGRVSIWYIKLSLHTDTRNNKHDERPFAYVYVFWQDDRKAFHVFRERWVQDAGRWYTRVVGLVAHDEHSPAKAD